MFEEDRRARVMRAGATGPGSAPMLYSSNRQRAAVVVLAFSGILGSLMQTLIIPLVTQLPSLLDTSVVGASWIVTATLLAGAVVTPISGRLGDIYGRRRILLICIALLWVGSVICALSSDLWILIAGRALQGMATSVIPLAMSILRDILEPRRLPVAIAVVSASVGIGGSIGLPIAAIVAEHFDWHVLFWGSAAVAAISFVLTVFVVPTDTVETDGHRNTFDYAGAAMLTVILVCFLVAITMASTWGWTDPSIAGMFGASAVLLVVFYFQERRIAQPLLNMTLFLSRPILSLNVVTVFTGFGMIGLGLIVIRVLQAPATTGYGLGLSITATGLCLAPGGLIILMCPPIASRLAAYRGSKLPLCIGIAIMASSYIVMSLAPFSIAVVVVICCVNSIGLALVLASIPALLMQSVTRSETAAATGQNALMRTIGTATSSAVVALMMTTTSVETDTFGFPSEMGIRLAFMICGVATVAAFVAALAIPQMHRGRVSGTATGRDALVGRPRNRAPADPL